MDKIEAIMKTVRVKNNDDGLNLKRNENGIIFQRLAEC